MACLGRALTPCPPHALHTLGGSSYHAHEHASLFKCRCVSPRSWPSSLIRSSPCVPRVVQLCPSLVPTNVHWALPSHALSKCQQRAHALLNTLLGVISRVPACIPVTCWFSCLSTSLWTVRSQLPSCCDAHRHCWACANPATVNPASARDSSCSTTIDQALAHKLAWFPSQLVLTWHSAVSLLLHCRWA